MATGSPPTIYPVKGIRLAAASASIHKKGRNDVALIEMSAESSVAAVFTCNQFKAAPIVVAKKHLAICSPRYLLINSGCANAGLGDSGIAATEACCTELARVAGATTEQVLPFSTGVIGEPLPVDRIEACLPQLYADLADGSWQPVAAAIMTTDTHEKYESCRLPLASSELAITGVAKGSGMIHPEMATMLAFIATDIAIDKQTLDELLQQGCDQSFNAITVDGDTSTNDACVLIATGQSDVAWQQLDDGEKDKFRHALTHLMQQLAKQIARDGEGASRLIEIKVSQARSEQEARTIARTIATSPLVKTACYAGDPNWGRIIAALGRGSDAPLDFSAVRCAIGNHCVFENGAIAPDYDETVATQEMSGTEIVISITLGVGDSAATVWTSDLTEEYIRINAEYRT